MISPLVIGTTLGATGVGVAALAQRLIDTVSFVLRATWRLALVAIGRVQNDPERLRRGVEEGMVLQVLLVGPIFGGLSMVSAVLVLHLFGHQWIDAVHLIPYLGLTAILGSIFLLPIAMLRALGRNNADTRRSDSAVHLRPRPGGFARASPRPYWVWHRDSVRISGKRGDRSCRTPSRVVYLYRGHSVALRVCSLDILSRRTASHSSSSLRSLSRRGAIAPSTEASVDVYQGGNARRKIEILALHNGNPEGVTRHWPTNA